MALTCADTMRTVFPTQVGDTVSARSNDLRGFSVRRVAAVGLPEDFGGPAFAEGAGEGVAELLVFGFQAADAIGGGFQPLQQRGAGCALPGSEPRRAWGAGGGSCGDARSSRGGVLVPLLRTERCSGARLCLEAEQGDGERARGGVGARGRDGVSARWRVCSVRWWLSGRRGRVAAKRYWKLTSAAQALVYSAISPQLSCADDRGREARGPGGSRFRRAGAGRLTVFWRRWRRAG